MAVSDTELLDCVNSFEQLERPSKIIEKCRKAVQKGLDPVSKAIVYGLLMSTYAKEEDLEKTHQALLSAREALGEAIGLTGDELKTFVSNARLEDRIFRAIDDKIDPREKLAENSMLRDIMLCPLYPLRSDDFREDLTENEKIEATLRWCSDFPGVILYLLLGDLWAPYNIDYAIKCFKILKKHEADGRPPQTIPTIAELAAGYKLGKLYKTKGDLASAKKEFEDVISARSHTEWHNQSDEERQLAEHWILKAEEDLADAERRLPKRGLFGRLLKF
ncbi:MAG: hypothetical protein QXQ94_09535 [Candidatus Bathyarchaeia archaeon]